MAHTRVNALLCVNLAANHFQHPASLRHMKRSIRMSDHLSKLIFFFITMKFIDGTFGS